MTFCKNPPIADWTDGASKNASFTLTTSNIKEENFDGSSGCTYGFLTDHQPCPITQRGVPVCKGAKSSHKIMEVFNDENESKKRNIKGTVVLMKKNVLDFNDFHASFLDRVHELLGQGVFL